jgi:hypothetical protein
MGRFIFSRLSVGDTSASKKYKAYVAALRQSVYLILLPILVCLIALGQANAQFAQQGSKLVGTGAVGGAQQGRSISLSSDGNTAIVGGYNDNGSAGAAWVWTRSAGVWTQQGSKLVGTGAVGGAQQGQSVSISSDGNTAIVGGWVDSSNAGAAWVWTRSGGIWTQQGSKLVGTGAVDPAYQGSSVSVSSDGNTAIVGGFFDDSGVGAVWVWTRSGGVWTQQGSKLVGTGDVGGAQQGRSVSLSSDGNTAIVGGISDNSNVGAAWVWTRSAGVWTQQGSKLVGTGVVGGAQQGWSISLSSDGNTAIVGGRDDNGSAGAAWVWTRSAGVWTQQGSKLVGTGAVGGAEQGQSVSLSSDGNTAMVGGNLDNGVGAAWAWKRSAGVWTQQGNKLVGTGAAGSAEQGWSVSLSSDGNTAIVGGYVDNTTVGAVWVYQFFGGPAAISSIRDIPSDQGGKIRVQWNKSGSDTTANAPHQTTYYGLWRRIPPGGAASSRSTMSLAKTMNDTLGTLYDFLTTVPAVQSPTYNVVAQTLSDSTSTGTHRYRYLVTAHTSDPNVFYLSPEDSGYSVDNLPPAAPGNAQTIQLANGPISVTWNRDRTDPDVAHYTVYRSTHDGFAVGPATQLTTSTDTTVVDATTSVGQTYYYRVTTVDIHDNESIPTVQLGTTALAVEITSFAAIAKENSIELAWTTATENNLYGFEVERESMSNWQKAGFVEGAGTSNSPRDYSFVDNGLLGGIYSYRLKQIDRDGKFKYSQSVEATINVPIVFTLDQNFPNPFNPTTTIRYGLPDRSSVRLVITNTVGQEVALLENGEQDAGYHEIEWRANVASGIYFYRLESVSVSDPNNRFVEVKKMLFLK